MQIVVTGRDAHGDVNVQCATGVKTGIDRGEAHDARLVGELPAAQIGIVIGARDGADITGIDLDVRVDLAPARIGTAGIAVPDIHQRIGDRLAGHGIDNGQPQHQRNAFGAFADVSADQFGVAEIRAGNLFGRQQVDRCRGCS
ncbi:hypothetical protein D3C79_938000 [compost metagenome]